MNDTGQLGVPRTLRQRVLRGTLASMFGIAALGLTRLVYTTMVGRTGSPERLAEVNAQISLAFIVTFLTASATGSAAAKFIPLVTARYSAAAAVRVRRRLARWTAVGTVACMAVVGLIGLFAPGLLPGGSPGGSSGEPGQQLIWLVLLIGTYGAYTFTKSVLYGYHRAARYATLEICADLGTLALTVVAVYWLPTALLAPLALGYGAFAVAAALSAPSVPQGERPDLGREVGGFVLLTAVGVVASQGFFQASMVVAGHAVSGQQAGVYAAAMSLVSPAFFLPRALALAFFPAAAEAVGRGDAEGGRAELATRTGQLTGLLWATMLPAFTVGAILGEPVMRLLYGSAYAGGGPVLGLMFAAVLLYVVAVPSVNALSAHELTQAKVPPLASVAGVLVGGVVWLVAGPTLGAVGVALGYFCGLTVQAGTPLLVASNRLGYRPGRASTLRAVAGGAAGVLAATVAIALTSTLVTLGCLLLFAAGYLALYGGQLRSLMRGRRFRSGETGAPAPTDP